MSPTPERRRGWSRTIALKDLLSADGSPSNVRRAAAEVAKRLKRDRAYDDIGPLWLIVDEFDGLAKSDDDDYGGPNETIAGHFNDALDSLYDWADAERVWIA